MKHATCKLCGANVDFGERCDCQKAEINADAVPPVEYEKLGRSFFEAAREAFKDPKVQKEFKDWQQARLKKGATAQ